MKRFIGYVLTAFAVVLFLLGLIFLIASEGQSSRLVSGIILVIFASGTAFLGGSLLKKAFDLSPEQVKNAILALAKENNGYLTKESINAVLGPYPEVDMSIEAMVLDGSAVLDSSSLRAVYVFPDFLHEIVEKYCSYCDTRYPLRDPIQKCTQCGGDIVLKKSRIEKKGQIFSMDEK